MFPLKILPKLRGRNPIHKAKRNFMPGRIGVKHIATMRSYPP